MKATQASSLLLSAVLVLTGCQPPLATPVPTASPAASAIPTPSAVASATPTSQAILTSVDEVKYLLLDRYPNVFFCDPDYYPIAREGGEQANAISQFTVIQQNGDEFTAILRHLGLQGTTSFTDDQKLAIYREHKRLSAVQVTKVDGAFTFSLRVGRVGDGQGIAYQGKVSAQGNVSVTDQNPVFNTCPICLDGKTLIETPSGPVPVADLRLGMDVWSVNASGMRVPEEVLAVVSRPAVGDIGLHIKLSDGREITASPSHPAPDGRLLASYTVGEALDGAIITSIVPEPFSDGKTYDILPSGDTGLYWANGILLKSTLAG